MLNIEELAERLSKRPRHVESEKGRMIAAVLIPLCRVEGEWHVLFTLRSAQVEHHKGQISFPGGKRDGDEELTETALRESEEEVGIKPDTVRIVGALDDIVTITNYRVTPFVGVFPYPWDVRLSLFEIDELLLIPLKELANPASFVEKTITVDGENIQIVGYLWQKHLIWGATARIFNQFLEVIE